jgi:GNAT superfamily N-acetyltransferase
MSQTVNRAEGIVVSEAPPTAAEYIDLRARAGWGLIDEETATRTIRAAVFTVSLRREQRLIGLARVMGDGVLYFFLADLVVDPAFRGERLGDRLMRTVTSYFDRCAGPGASITLVALNGGESFYEKFGFARCPDGPFGSGMHYRAAPPPAAMPRSA